MCDFRVLRLLRQNVTAQGLAVPDQGLSSFCSYLSLAHLHIPATPPSVHCPCPVSQEATPWLLASHATLDRVDHGNRPTWALEAGMGHLGRDSEVSSARAEAYMRVGMGVGMGSAWASVWF